jgi:two-component sensor histidine kinase
MEIDVADITLDIDTVIPCALIINELVSNSLKHAFPDSWRQTGGAGEIRIDFHRDADNRFALTVTDNGVGLPAGFDVQHCESLGLKLVGVLVKQLRGVLHRKPGAGAGFTITFEAPK